MRALLPVLMFLGLTLASAARADERGREVETFMDEYLRLWNAHDAGAIVERVYRLESSNPMGTRAGLEAEFARLKARGYDHSAKTSIEACVIARDRALAEFRFSRLKADGSPVGPGAYATLYVLRRFPEGWRITQLIGFDPSADLDCHSFGG